MRLDFTRSDCAEDDANVFSGIVAGGLIRTASPGPTAICVSARLRAPTRSQALARMEHRPMRGE